MTQQIILETKRLILRPITEKDNDSLLKLFSDPIAMQYFPGTKTRKDTDDWIRMIINRYEKDGFSFYLCVTKETRDVIGYCGLILQEDVNGKNEVEIGYGLIRHFWHQGYATEAAIGCKEYGFNKLRLKKIISLIRPENKPSINVALRNGMSWQQNIMRWNYMHGIYVILKD